MGYVADDGGGGVQTEPQVLVIRASEWMRGGEAGRLHYGGQYCCLGLDALRVGLSAAQMGNAATPEGVADIAPAEYRERWCETDPFSLRYIDSNDADEAVTINDSAQTTDEQKIEALRPIFARHGITIDWRPEE